MGTLITDPNAAPDPTQVADIPDNQAPGDGWVGRLHNPVMPGVPPSADYPTGIAPDANAVVADTGEEKRWRTMQRPEAPAEEKKPPPMAKQMPAPPEPPKPEPKHDKADDRHAAHKK